MFKLCIIQNYTFSIETHYYIVLFYFRLVKGLPILLDKLIV